MRLCKYCFTNSSYKEGKLKKILSLAYSLNLKNIILVLNRGLFVFCFFFWNGHIRNVVSTLSNVVQFNVEIHNVVSTLLNVVDFNVDVRNVVSTLIWRCVTLRRHFNLFHTWWNIRFWEKIQQAFWSEIKLIEVVYRNMKECILEANLKGQVWQSSLFTILLILTWELRCTQEIVIYTNRRGSFWKLLCLGRANYLP